MALALLAKHHDDKISNTAESGFREQPPCRHLRSLNPDWSLNPDSSSSRKFPNQKSEASKSRPASKYQFSKSRPICMWTGQTAYGLVFFFIFLLDIVAALSFPWTLLLKYRFILYHLSYIWVPIDAEPISGLDWIEENVGSCGLQPAQNILD